MFLFFLTPLFLLKWISVNVFLRGDYDNIDSDRIICAKKMRAKCRDVILPEGQHGYVILADRLDQHELIRLKILPIKPRLSET